MITNQIIHDNIMKIILLLLFWFNWMLRKMIYPVTSLSLKGCIFLARRSVTTPSGNPCGVEPLRMCVPQPQYMTVGLISMWSDLKISILSLYETCSGLTSSPYKNCRIWIGTGGKKGTWRWANRPPSEKSSADGSERIRSIRVKIQSNGSSWCWDIVKPDNKLTKFIRELCFYTMFFRVWFTEPYSHNRARFFPEHLALTLYPQHCFQVHWSLDPSPSYFVCIVNASFSFLL